MVYGIEMFREYFKDYCSQYVLIGGTACDILFGEMESNFRATRDMDMVLIVEAQTKEFGQRFWKFIRDGEYRIRAKSNGSPQFYRFDKPSVAGYPKMIELFAREEWISEESPVIPIHIDDAVSSLSAILLNSEYYRILLDGHTVVDGISVLKPTYLIPFKVKAWLDLSARKAQGETIDSRDIKKHKNDIVRLSTEMILEKDIQLPRQVKEDMAVFIEGLRKEPADLKNLKIMGVKNDDIVSLLQEIYLR